MKQNILFINSFLFIFFISIFQQINAQIKFKEDFGSSTARISSQYVPQSGQDANLSGSFTHGSKFYKFASIQPDYNGENQNQNVIDNGYYAVVAPANVYSNLPSGLPSWANWWSNILNHSNTSPSGAVLVVNGGEILNQYYRRAIALERGKTYQISAWLYGAGAMSVGVKFEAQNIGTELVLGSSPNLLLTATNTWEKKSWVFTVPDNDNCANIAISLRNAVSTNNVNDFYVDDIILEEVTGTTGTLIDCSNTSSFDTIIKANNDTYTLTNNNGGTFNILWL